MSSTSNTKHTIVNNCSKLSELIFDIKDNINDQQYKTLLDYCKEIYDSVINESESEYSDEESEEESDVENEEEEESKHHLFYEEVDEIEIDEKTNIIIHYNNIPSRYPSSVTECQCKKYKINENTFEVEFNCIQNNLFIKCKYTQFLYKDFPLLEMIKELLYLKPVDQFIPISFTFVPVNTLETTNLNSFNSENLFHKYRFILNMSEEYSKIILPCSFRGKDYRILTYVKQLLFLISIEYIMNHIEILSIEPFIKDIILRRFDDLFINQDCINVIQEKLQFNIVDVLNKWKQVLN